jgi:hypothetical protein
LLEADPCTWLADSEEDQLAFLLLNPFPSTHSPKGEKLFFMPFNMSIRIFLL